MRVKTRFLDMPVCNVGTAENYTLSARATKRGLSPRGCFMGLGHPRKKGKQLKSPKGRRKLRETVKSKGRGIK